MENVVCTIALCARDKTMVYMDQSLLTKSQGFSEGSKWYIIIHQTVCVRLRNNYYIFFFEKSYIFKTVQ